MDNTEFLLQEIEGLEKSLKEANDIIEDYRVRFAEAKKRIEAFEKATQTLEQIQGGIEK